MKAAVVQILFLILNVADANLYPNCQKENRSYRSQNLEITCTCDAGENH